ncbi:MAG: nucleotide pyrophosphohydrolase [candidate division NC10 bacterium]|nr:nucleotide pyrophosphohydrolase [candidate division NC10 bacterium]MBI4391271.1 nucleotide pyrophosphohydrolase [candidate division NC10 bacterium]
MRDLQRRVAAFRDARDWRRFHAPKDLAISIALEAAELLEHFQWKDAAAVAAHLHRRRSREALAAEMADVLLLLLSLADVLGVDLKGAALRKLRVNARRYPVARARGTALKYRALRRAGRTGGTR